jgi:hypothetical protein
MDRAGKPKDKVMEINYSGLPEHMRDTFRLYIEKGIPPGSFTKAVLSNDLMGAMRRADHINRARIFDTCAFLEVEAPIGCYGSPERVSDWIKRGGISGDLERAEP